MIDKIIYKFFGWVDSLFEKLDDVLTYDIGQENKKKNKKK